MTERTDHVGKLIAGAKRVQQASALADALDDECDAAASEIRINYGQRYALGVFVSPDDDEVTGFAFPGDFGSFDDEAADAFSYRCFFEYSGSHRVPLNEHVAVYSRAYSRTIHDHFRVLAA